jgi:hypothetical protein
MSFDGLERSEGFESAYSGHIRPSDRRMRLGLHRHERVGEILNWLGELRL